MPKLIIRQLLIILMAVLITLPSWAAGVKVIFDQDEGSDPDCTGFLLKLAELGECEVIAMGSYFTDIWGARALEAAAKYYNMQSIPIGINKTTSESFCGVGYCDWFGTHVANYFNITTKSYPDVVDVYRTALAAQADNSVIIIAMGPIKNLWHLYISPADEISDMTGAQLIQAKVKAIYLEGLDYPSYGPGDDTNFAVDAPIAKNFIDAMTVMGMKMVYSGNYTAGALVFTDALTAPVDSYTYQSYCYYSKPPVCGRPAWGHIDVLHALRGESWNGVKYLNTSVEGKNVLTEACNQNWWVEGDYNQFYITLNVEPSVLQVIVDDIQNAAVGAPIQYPLIEDLLSPTCTITTPATSPYDNGTSTSITISGTASADTGVISVTWSNSLGGSGTCTGTTSWSANITGLSVGDNVITITAHDAADNTGTDTVTVRVSAVTSSVITSGFGGKGVGMK
jgi:hypothetical protein